MARDPIPTWFFAVVVVRQEDRFLLVHESKHGQQWYLPAGRVEPGETLAEAAARETLEETGVPVRITGVIRVEHSPRGDYARLRVVFLAEPTDDTPPKSQPDEESLAAAWVRWQDLDLYPLRGEDVRDLIGYVLEGGAVYPPELIQKEGRPFRGMG
jgi:8-oxo-dGTP pyrophosphatase MutT (NUDIX family)